MDSLGVDELREECARLEDLLTALTEAQPKAAKERMNKIIAERTDSKLEKCRTKHEHERQRVLQITIGTLGTMVIALGLAVFYNQ